MLFRKQKEKSLDKIIRISNRRTVLSLVGGMSLGGGLLCASFTAGAHVVRTSAAKHGFLGEVFGAILPRFVFGFYQEMGLLANENLLLTHLDVAYGASAAAIVIGAGGWWYGMRGIRNIYQNYGVMRR